MMTGVLWAAALSMIGLLIFFVGYIVYLGPNGMVLRID